MLMLGRLVLMLAAAALAAGCGSPPTIRSTAPASPASLQMAACDDGGSGGVMIDGVCL
jgi:uncharacterized lipoprotein YajG